MRPRLDFRFAIAGQAVGPVIPPGSIQTMTALVIEPIVGAMATCRSWVDHQRLEDRIEGLPAPLELFADFEKLCRCRSIGVNPDCQSGAVEGELALCRQSMNGVAHARRRRQERRRALLLVDRCEGMCRTGGASKRSLMGESSLRARRMAVVSWHRERERMATRQRLQRRVDYLDCAHARQPMTNSANHQLAYFLEDART